jgi:hypothetical protein
MRDFSHYEISKTHVLEQHVPFSVRSLYTSTLCLIYGLIFGRLHELYSDVDGIYMSMMCVVDTHKVHHIYTWDTSSRMMTCRFHYLCLVA